MQRSYVMQFLSGDAGDMQKLNVLCAILRSKGTCFSITDTTIRGEQGYEVYWHIQPERKVTRFGVPDRRQR